MRNLFISIMLFLLMISQLGCPGKAPQADGKLIVPLTSDPTTFDPVSMWDATSHGRCSALIYNGLMRSEMNGQPVPDLADTVQITPDGLTYLFHLRSGVRFSNGQSLTAADVKYSFERLLRESPNAWLLNHIVGAKAYTARMTDSTATVDSVGVQAIEIVDPTTVRLTLERPFSPFLSILALPQTYITSRTEVEDQGENYGQHPIGTGPYILKEWQPDYLVRFEANPTYFGTAPKIRTVEYRVIKEELTALAEFEAGNLSFLPIPDAEYRHLMTDEKWKQYIVSQNMLNIYAINLNCAKPPFNDKRVRQALNYAIDRQAILERVLNGRGVLAKGPIPPGLPGYSLDRSGYAYDPEKAKQLLREAGYGDGFEFEIWQSSNSATLTIMEAFQSYLAEVGIKVKIIQNEWSVLKTAVRKGELDSYYRAWSADYPDAENFLFPVFHSEQPTGSNLNYKNPKFDRLIELAQQTSDTTQRITLYQVAEEIIVEDAPWVFFYHGTDAWVHQPNVKNLRIPLIFNADKFTDVWLESADAGPVQPK